MTIELDPVRVVVLSVIVLWIGGQITARVAVLRRYSIPIAVTGGLLCSVTDGLFAPFWISPLSSISTKSLTSTSPVVSLAASPILSP